MVISFHESDDRLELYALGRMPDSEVVQIEEHLFICDGCRVRLDDIAVFAHSVREELIRQPIALPVKWFDVHWFGWLRPQFALAGAFALALLAFGLLSLRPDRRIPLASLQLTAMRGSMETIHAARETDVTLTDMPPTGGPFRFEVVNELGAPTWSGMPSDSNGRPQLKIAKSLAPGSYFVRAWTPAGKLLHEYGFRVADE